MCVLSSVWLFLLIISVTERKTHGESPPAVSLCEREGLQSVSHTLSHASVFFKQMRPQREHVQTVRRMEEKQDSSPRTFPIQPPTRLQATGFLYNQLGLTLSELGRCANADYSVSHRTVQTQHAFLQK